jgi:hypothetical protein
MREKIIGIRLCGLEISGFGDLFEYAAMRRLSL